MRATFAGGDQWKSPPFPKGQGKATHSHFDDLWHTTREGKGYKVSNKVKGFEGMKGFRHLGNKRGKKGETTGTQVKIRAILGHASRGEMVTANKRLEKRGGYFGQNKTPRQQTEFQKNEESCSRCSRERQGRGWGKTLKQAKIQE